MRSATRPDLVIFDCDGVLIDSELVQRRIDAEYLQGSDIR
jgi:beta-phosphoglucomutase-like phosphatase (HAD superfamily)